MFRANAPEGQKRFPISRTTIEVATASICITAETKSRTGGSRSPADSVGTSVRGMGGKNGITLEYAANNDLQYRPELSKHCKLVLSVGHDEYWSAGCAIILKEVIQRLETGLSSREHVLLADS